MIFILVVILLIILIVAVSKGNKKKNLEIEQLEKNNQKSDPIEKDDKSPSISDELIKLKKLLEDGILTQDEFNAQKGKILK